MNKHVWYTIWKLDMKFKTPADAVEGYKLYLGTPYVDGVTIITRHESSESVVYDWKNDEILYWNEAEGLFK